MQKVFRTLAPVLSEHGFYLAGGTAVALYFGHRRSVDLDWFRSEPIPEPRLLEGILHQAGIEFITRVAMENTLIIKYKRTNVSMFAYPYPLIASPREWADYRARIASPEDLVCMKLAAVLQRGTKRDFIDLYLLLQSIPLPRAFELYMSKYRTDDVVPLLYALTYFEDADKEPRPYLHINLSWRTVKAFLRRQVEQAFR